MEKPDWTLLHSFLLIARHGSLTQAARVSGLSQPTLGRHLRTLEDQLGASLFVRQAKGQELTALGQEILPLAEGMESSVAKMALAASGAQPGLVGSVRITASRVVAHHLLPPILAELRHMEPGIQIDLVASDATENLLFHEADIALRMYRPTEPDIVTRHVVNLDLALYGETTLLDRLGRPKNEDELLALPFIGFDTSDLILRVMSSFGIHRRREDFALRCDDQLVYINLVRAGAGIGALQVKIGDSDPGLERIAPFLKLPPLPLWLATASRLSQAPRIRRVWDHLAAGLSGLKTTQFP